MERSRYPMLVQMGNTRIISINAKTELIICMEQVSITGGINMNDNVNKPSRYQGSKGLESIEVIDNFIGNLSGKAAWCWGNAIKYLLRFQDRQCERFAFMLKQKRLDNKLSREALSKKLGYSQSLIKKWECLEVHPNLYNVEDVATYFDLPVNVLIGEE